jgi:hypothetical protein
LYGFDVVRWSDGFRSLGSLDVDIVIAVGSCDRVSTLPLLFLAKQNLEGNMMLACPSLVALLKLGRFISCRRRR